MAASAMKLEDHTIQINQEIQVQASLEETFAALLEQLGPENDRPDGVRMNMKIEAWPGGRWFRDLGDGNGHFWGVVQAIKRPMLLEFCGPMFMSAPVMSNVQYRLSEKDGGTLIKFQHKAFGLIEPDYRLVREGWTYIHEKMRQRAEKARKR